MVNAANPRMLDRTQYLQSATIKIEIFFYLFTTDTLYA
jgi:hypothetical protein